MSWLFAFGRLLKLAGRWLLDHPVAAILLLFALQVAAHQFVIDPRLRASTTAAIAERDKARTEREEEIAAHRQTKLDYRAAQTEAARLEQERLAHVEAQQQEITDDVVQSYESRLADARARAEQLRRDLSRAGEHPSGTSGGERLPGAGDAAGGAAQAAGDHRLPAGAHGDLDWRLIATEQAIQLDELISWTLRQAAVEMNRTAEDEGAR